METISPTEDTEPVLTEEDTRAVIRLLGDVCAVQGGHAEQKRFLIEGLCRLIDADRWAWGLAYVMTPGQPPNYVGMLHGGFDDYTYSMFTRAYMHPSMAEIQQRFFDELTQRQTHLTRTRSQLDPEDSFIEKEAFPLWQAANINGVIMSLRPMDATSFSTTVLYRRVGAPVFSKRDNRLAHIVLSEVPWLHAQGWPEDRGITVPQLSPRQRITMNLLLQGQTKKQIARNLEISEHTVQDYIKAVHAHFGVHSRAGLMSRFHLGNGGDR